MVPVLFYFTLARTIAGCYIKKFIVKSLKDSASNPALLFRVQDVPDRGSHDLQVPGDEDRAVQPTGRPEGRREIIQQQHTG